MTGRAENMNIVELENICYSYRVGKNPLPVLKGVSRDFHRGGWHCIYGASGSGKTTLLNMIGAIERPDSGVLRVDGVDVSALGRREAARFRAERIGFVFQSYQLLPELTVAENVILPARFAGGSLSAARNRAAGLLEKVGLKERMHHRPTELSGGEQQRASIARALINSPRLLLADEPTGNLDAATGEEILKLFSGLREADRDFSIIMITHNRDIAAMADSVSVLTDGILTVESGGEAAAADAVTAEVHGTDIQ